VSPIATALAALAVALLASCRSSPQTHFYTLTPVAPTGRTADSSGTPVKIAAVHIPGVLDRNSIIRGEANYQLDISSQERWGADLGEMIRQTLTQNLQQRLPDGMVIPPRSPAPEDTRGLVVDIVDFGPDGSGHVKLEATWTVLEGSPARVLLQRTAQLSEARNAPPQPADAQHSSSAAAQAAAMSVLLGQLADQIASGVSQLREARQ
jgi:uncharacterized lipoprotein YmbA